MDDGVVQWEVEGVEGERERGKSVVYKDEVEPEMLSNTSIHGAVVTLSPVKKGRKAMFFDGLLADETSQIRLVGFQGMQTTKVE